MLGHGGEVVRAQHHDDRHPARGVVDRIDEDAEEVGHLRVVSP